MVRQPRLVATCVRQDRVAIRVTADRRTVDATLYQLHLCKRAHPGENFLHLSGKVRASTYSGDAAGPVSCGCEEEEVMSKGARGRGVRAEYTARGGLPAPSCLKGARTVHGVSRPRSLEKIDGAVRCDLTQGGHHFQYNERLPASTEGMTLKAEH